MRDRVVRATYDVRPDHVVVPDERTDPEIAVRHVNRVKTGNPVDVDEHRWLREPELHQRDHSLSAGEHFGLVTTFAQNGQRFVERGGCDVVEARWVHTPSRYPDGSEPGASSG